MVIIVRRKEPHALLLLRAICIRLVIYTPAELDLIITRLNRYFATI